MNLIFKDIKANKKIFCMLFIGFLLSIIPISIAISTKKYYDNAFYSSKNGYFKYYYSITLSKYDGIELKELQDTAEKTFINSSVITEDTNIAIPNIGNCQVVGLLNYNNWIPPLVKGRNINSNDINSIIIGNKIHNFIDKINLYSTEYSIVGISGEDNSYVFDYKLYIPLKYMPKEMKGRFKKSTLQINVRSNENSQNEIDEYISQLKSRNNDVKITIANMNGQYEKEKNSNQMVKEILSFPYTLFIIALINGVNISYFWIYKKRKDISLRKALGASNLNLFSFIFGQLFLCAILASIFTILIQIFLVKLNVKMNNFSISLDYFNILVSVLASVFISFVTSIIPFIQIISIQPARALKE